jgi:spore maturation protein CgeB
MTPRVFGVDYQFWSAGDVFTQGLAHAADTLGVPYAHALWSDPQLPAKVQAFVPDLLLVVHGRDFVHRWHDTFHGVRSAVWLTDEPYEVDDTAQWTSRFGQVFVNDPSSLARHPHATYLPACADPVLHYATDEPPAFRVGFVGGPSPLREQYLAALANVGLLDYVMGGPWRMPRVQRLSRTRVSPPRETAARYRQTAIIVNVFRDRHHYNRDGLPATALNPRIYEAVACGALVLSDPRPELTRLVPSLPTFGSAAECVTAVADFLAHPTVLQARARACRAELAGQTYAARLQAVLATVGQLQEVA